MALPGQFCPAWHPPVTFIIEEAVLGKVYIGPLSVVNGVEVIPRCPFVVPGLLRLTASS